MLLRVTGKFIPQSSIDSTIVKLLMHDNTYVFLDIILICTPSHVLQ